MTLRAWATLDLDALRHNLRKVRDYAPGRRVMAAVKANAYGHGAVPVAKALGDADAFAVATLDEALELRAAGIHAPIVLLGGVAGTDDLAQAVQHGLNPVVHDEAQLRLLEAIQPGNARVWIKLDTGMHRLGFAPGAINDLRRRLSALKGVTIAGWMTHLASADEPQSGQTKEQLAEFEKALQGVPGERSIANSAGIVGWPESHADWVRPGIMLYGGSPLYPARTAEQLGLLPVMTLRSRLLSTRKLGAGEPVGYGATWRTPEPMRIGVVSAGYADGYPRHAPSDTPILLNGRRTQTVGRVSMDLVCIDLRGHDNAREGDEVVLWGEGLSADAVAHCAGTVSYQLFCNVSRRVPVEYHGQS